MKLNTDENVDITFVMLDVVDSERRRKKKEEKEDVRRKSSGVGRKS
jgi:hypothetical protein